MPSSGIERVADRVMLDTSAYSHMRRGAAEILDAVSEAQVVVLPVTVLGELEAAFRLGSRQRENSRALSEFLREPYVTVAETTADVARRYGELFATLRSHGTPLPVNDIWIAATALATGAQLLTYDRDFSRIPSLSRVLFPRHGGER